MISRMRVLLLCVVFVLGATAVALAARCPYCGMEYGEGAPGDEAYIARIRAEHEANCPMRPGNGGGGGGAPRQTVDWEAQREAYIARADGHYTLGQALFDKGDYDGAIKEANAALWMRWGNKQYTELLTRAQTRKRAAVEHDAGLALEKTGQWDAAIANFDAGVKDHPENETYVASLARAREAKRLADQARFDQHVASLADEMSRQGPSTPLAFHGAGSDRRPSIDRIEVPVPRVREKDYFQIKTPTEWPKVPTQVVQITNVALKVFQEGAGEAYDHYMDWAKEQTLGRITEKIPGYETYESLKEKHKELYEGVSAYTLGLFDSDMRAVREGVRAVANPNDRGDLAEEHARKVEEEGRRVQFEAMKLAGKSAKWGIEGKWKLESGEKEGEPDHEKSGVVPIDKKRTDAYPDPFRTRPWIR